MSAADYGLASSGDPLRTGVAPDACPAPTPGPSRAGFLAQVDGCVRRIAAWLGAAEHERAAERCHAQLWRWLHERDARLDDGTPIDFALFDAAIQRVGERLPRRGLPGQDRLLQAAWLLAELTYARTLTDIPLQGRAP